MSLQCTCNVLAGPEVCGALPGAGTLWQRAVWPHPPCEGRQGSRTNPQIQVSYIITDRVMADLDLLKLYEGIKVCVFVCVKLTFNLPRQMTHLLNQIGPILQPWKTGHMELIRTERAYRHIHTQTRTHRHTLMHKHTQTEKKDFVLPEKLIQSNCVCAQWTSYLCSDGLLCSFVYLFFFKEQ